MPRGGYRRGAGRKPGPASLPVDWLDADGLTPLEALLAIAGNADTPMRLRVWAAKEAALYCHRKLALP